MKFKASPFGALLGHKITKLPASSRATVVVAGEVVQDVRQIDARLRDPCEADDWSTAAARRLRAEVARAKARARYQSDRMDPAKMAKRKAWADQNPELVREYRRRNRTRNAERNRELQNEWARQNYHADIEAAQAKARDYYARNRERILAGLKAKRAADKASKGGAES